MLVNVSVSQGVELVFYPLVTEKTKGSVCIQLQLSKERTDFQKNHARGLLFMLSLSLFNTFVL